MNIISYRGPGKGGGVSTALERLFKDGDQGQTWWYLDSGKIKCRTGDNLRAFVDGQMGEQLASAHYRYANEFIWPIMHDLAEYAKYREADHFLYNRFNKILGNEIIKQTNEKPYFIQDYQLALLPKIFKEYGLTSAIFWHIPWPSKVPTFYLAPIIELAQSLLEADLIGFHTKEYARNFRNFVKTHIASTSTNVKHASHLRVVRQSSIAKPIAKSEVIAAPLGLDHLYWSSLLKDHKTDKFFHPSLQLPFFLSVDRTDYTKGITNRLRAIDQFFQDHDELKTKLLFVQVCTASRAGILAYDEYRHDCENLTAQINAKFSTPQWQPIITIEDPMPSSELALLYSNASVMLVNPLRDGLNLTAKEFVACQKKGKAGVLALSRGAGVFEEFGNYAVTLNPMDAREMANVMYCSWTMPVTEKEFRAAKLKEELKHNSLETWNKAFIGRLEAEVMPSFELALASEARG